ncbi:MAG: hypothetical protein LBF82_02375 [Lactobacillales bacterium]|jgi:ABC-type transport system involved in multi-copper enzyme maturation permease subunit|nr:hypothetical protein [Lactobacillales bacterium]
MRFFRLEIKRILSSLRTKIIFSIILLLSVLMAYSPIRKEEVSYQDSHGKLVELTGREALQYKKKIQRPSNKELTSAKLKKALTIFQDFQRKYPETRKGENITKNVAELQQKKISPIVPLLSIIEMFINIPKQPNSDFGDYSYDGLTLMKPQDMDSFYTFYSQQLRQQISQRYKSAPKIQKKAMKMNAKIKKPFQLYAGYTNAAFDSFSEFIFLLVVLCLIIAVPTFSHEYETGTDAILRCTKKGRSFFVFTKISALFFLFFLVSVFSLGLHLLILNVLFGFDCCKTSIQLVSSFSVNPTVLLNSTVGGTQIILAIGGMLTLFATISLTLFFSARFKNSLTVLVISLAACFFPTLGRTLFDGQVNWLICLFPSAGVGSGNSLYRQLMDLNFLRLGSTGFFSPYVILLAAVLAIPIFLFLTVRSYNKHQAN